MDMLTYSVLGYAYIILMDPTLHGFVSIPLY